MRCMSVWRQGERPAGAAREERQEGRGFHRPARRRATVAATALAGLIASAASAPAAGRVALVIGNGEYTRTSALSNPANDASDVAAALRRLDFDVVLRLDADEQAMDDALSAFEERSAGADVALVFYAGHGLEMNGANYLVPVDARLVTAGAVARETVSLNSVLDATLGARTRIVILDACRNNPFARSMRGATRANVRSGGLAAVSTGEGLLVAYAAAAGAVAADGKGRNSPYTSALLAHVSTPGVDVRVMLGDVGGAVRAATGDQQPFIYASLTGQHYLAGAPLAGAERPGIENAASSGFSDAAAVLQQETEFWRSVQDIDSVEAYLSYESAYPGGRFAVLSRLRRSGLGAEVDPPTGRGVGEVFRDCASCPEMVVVPAGSYMMGSSAVYQRPRHRVTIGSPFAVGVYEVTFAEWDACVAGGGCGGRRPDDEGWGRGARPVINVSWEDARSYVRWLSLEAGANYRLLSEAQWEYVARAGTGTRYWWGESVGRNRAHCDGCGSRWDDTQTATVGSFAANGFGLYDVLGNVWEWVEDCWQDNYADAPSDGSAWTQGSCRRRVIRGGSWSTVPEFFGSANRITDGIGTRDVTVGFRVSRTVD